MNFVFNATIKATLGERTKKFLVQTNGLTLEALKSRLAKELQGTVADKRLTYKDEEGDFVDFDSDNEWNAILASLHNGSVLCIHIGEIVNSAQEAKAKEVVKQIIGLGNYLDDDKQSAEALKSVVDALEQVANNVNPGLWGRLIGAKRTSSANGDTMVRQEKVHTLEIDIQKSLVNLDSGTKQPHVSTPSDQLEETWNYIVVENHPQKIIDQYQQPTNSYPFASEVKPVDRKPIETRPVESKPVEMRPVETIPVDVKPVEPAKVANPNDPFVKYKDCINSVQEFGLPIDDNVLELIVKHNGDATLICNEYYSQN